MKLIVHNLLAIPESILNLILSSFSPFNSSKKVLELGGRGKYEKMDAKNISINGGCSPGTKLFLDGCINNLLV